MDVVVVNNKARRKCDAKELTGDGRRWNSEPRSMEIAEWGISMCRRRCQRAESADKQREGYDGLPAEIVVSGRSRHESGGWRESKAESRN